jgi:hypothetical protein
MAEDRAPENKEEPPGLVPIVNNDANHTLVSRVQTIQLTPQKQQVGFFFILHKFLI